MALLLFIIFIVLPIAEIAVFIEAAHLITVPVTIALTLATAFLGSFLLRQQGLAALQRFAAAVEKGKVPVIPVLDGMGIVVAAILLMTPGFVTDALGLLLFIPPVRRAAGRWAFQQLLKSGSVHVHYHGATTDWPGAGQGPRPKGAGKHKSDNVVDAEFETIDPGETGQDAAPAGRADDNGRSRDRRSPWRLK